MGQGGINIMDAIKYLKLDFRIMKEKKQYIYLVLIPIFIGIMLNYWEFGITGLLVFVMIYIGFPFSNENADKLEKMYGLLPCKPDSMVLGRFIYLNIMMIITILICFGTGIYYFTRNTFEMLTMVDMVVAVVLSVILNFFSYPIYYKAQLEKNNIMKTAVILIISIVIFLMTLLIPAELAMINSVYSNELISIGSFIVRNRKLFISVAISILLVLGYVTYLCSCRICRKKEV